jgi:hypothetical protein
MKKHNKKKTAPPNPCRLVKLDSCIYRLAGNLSNIPGIEPLIPQTQSEEWTCLLCFAPTKERVWSVPEHNAPQDYTGSLIYAVCEKHERNKTTEELARYNLHSRLRQIMIKQMRPDNVEQKDETERKLDDKSH